MTSRLWIPLLVAVAIMIGLFFLFDGGATESVDDAAGGTTVVEDVAELSESDPADVAVEEDPVATVDAGGQVVTYTVLDAITLDPIKNAVVTIEETRSGSAQRIQLARLRTASDGTVEVSVPPKRSGARYPVRVDASGYLAVRRTLAQSVHVPAPILLSRGIRVTGQVVNEAGQPVSPGIVHGLSHLSLQRTYTASGELFLYRPGLYGQAMAEVATLDSEGRFAIDVSGETAAVQVEASGYAPAFSEPLTLQREGPNSVTVVVSPGREVRGLVTNTAGEPVAGAAVSFELDAEGDRFERFVTQMSATTDEAGLVVFEDSTPMFQRIRASHPEYLSKSDWNYRGQAGGDPFEITLEPAQWLTLRLVDAGGQPLALEGVALRAGRRHVQLESEGDGRYRSKPFSAEMASAKMNLANGYAPQELSWEAGPGERDLGTIAVMRGPAVSVLVHDEDGAAIKSAYVTLTKPSTGEFSFPETVARGRSDAAGKVDLAAPPAVLDVLVQHYLYGTWRQQLRVREAGAELLVTLSRAARVIATLEDASGEPLMGAQVQVTDDAVPVSPWLPSAFKYSDPQGRVAIGSLSAGAELTLTVTKTGYPEFVEPIALLSPGETRDLGIVVLSGGTEVLGRVVDKNGNGVAFATVSGSVDTGRRSRNRAGNLVTRADKEGHFRFGGLEEKTYVFRAQADAYIASEEKSVGVTSEGADPLVIELARGYECIGRVEYEDGSPASGATVRVRVGRDWQRQVRTTADETGQFRLAVPPSGDLTMTVLSKGSRKEFQAAKADQLPSVVSLAVPAQLDVVVNVVGERKLSSLRLRYRLDGTGRERRGSLNLENGRGVLYAAPGDWELALTVPGFPDSDPVKAVLVAGGVTEVVVTIDGTATGTPVVVVDDEGNPLAGARVGVFDADSRDSYRMYAVANRGDVTDAQGVFVAYAMTDKSAISVEAAGFADFYEASAVSLLAGGRVRVALQREAVFIVNVFEADGTRAQDVTAFVKDGPPGRKSRSRSTRIRMPGMNRRAGGAIRLAGLVPGEYKVAVARAGVELVERVVSLSRGEEKSIDFELAPELTLTGTVYMNGEAVSGGEVHARRGSGQVEAPVSSSGQYSLKLPGAGKYWITYISSIGNGLGRHQVDVSKTSQLDLRLDVVRFGFRYLLPSGEPAAGLKGTLAGPSSEEFSVDESGNVVCENLEPGTYTVHTYRVPARLFAPQVTIRVPEDEGRVLKLVEARVGHFRVTNDVKPRWASIHRVDAQGNRDVVGALRRRSSSEDVQEVTLPKEMTQGYVHIRGYPELPFRIAAGAMDVDVALTLREGGTVKVEVVADIGEDEETTESQLRVEPGAGGELAEFLRDVWTRSGKKTLHLLPGEYRISAKIGGVEVHRDVTVIVGETQDLALRR
ncbi:MAG: carboxypeptidase regulatory-like domain-containing protein [Planctomycetota bacterium]